MPAVSAPNLSLLRGQRHGTKLRVAIHTPAAIWTGRVNGTQTTGDTTIAVDGVSQVRAPAKNYLVLFGTTAGARDLGEARFRSYSAPTLTVSEHNATLTDDAFVTVLETIRPEAIHPTVSASDVVSEDGNIAYTNENLQYMPLARMGPPAVAYRDESTGLATVNFYSSSAAFGGATLSSYAWSFPSGTPNTSAIAGTAGTPIAVTWNTSGQYWVSLTVTDSNGKTHTTYRPVFIYDHVTGTTPYTQLEVNGMEGDREGGGWTCGLTVFCDAPESAFPTGAMVVVFAEDYFGSTQTGIGGQYTHRENIVMAGFIVEGSVERDVRLGRVDFQVEGLGSICGGLWQIAGSLETTAGTPGGWHVLKNMTYELAAHHILTQHSTVTQIADCYLNLPSYTVANVDLIDGSLSDNLQQIAAATRSLVGSSAQGMLYIEANPQLLPLASRTNPVVLSTTLADFRDQIDFGAEAHRKAVSQIDFAGENATAAPVFSLAPSKPWPTGHSEKVDGIRVTDQTESNVIAGLYEAYRNNSYSDVVVQWRGNYRVFDVFPIEALQVSIAANQNKRGLVWSNQRCWVKRVSYEYRPGILLASAVIEKDSYGALGVTGQYPAAEPTPTVPPPGVEPGIIDPPVPPIGPSTMPGDGSRVYVATDKGVAICDNFLTSPTWTAINSGLSGDALDVFRLLFDPWSSDGSKLTTAYISTRNGIWKGTGLPTPTWTQVLDAAGVEALIGTNGGAAKTHFTRELVLSINVQNHVGILARRTLAAPVGKENLYYVYSTDGGATWNCNTSAYWQDNVTADLWRKANNEPAFAWASNTVAGTLYVSSKHDFLGGSWKLGITKSTDGGATWVWQGRPTTDYSSYPVIPFANNAGTPYTDDTRAWRSCVLSGAHTGQFVEFSTTFPGPFNPTNWTDKTDGATGNLSWLMDICTWNEDYMYVLNDDSTPGLFSTNDQAVNWVSSGNLGVNFYALSALPYNRLFCACAGEAAGPTAKVYRTLDGGATWVDATGDLNTALASITSMRSIVPDWIKVT